MMYSDRGLIGASGLGMMSCLTRGPFAGRELWPGGRIGVWRGDGVVHGGCFGHFRDL
jgi:hypothetical protein